MRRAIAPWLGWDAVEHDVAWDRAEDLLRDSITAEQYGCYRTHGYLEVRSRTHPGRVYRVDGWRPVAVFEHGQFVGAVCIRPREALPGPDVVLARKLLIEGSEEEFLRSGNWLSPAWRPASAAPSVLLILVLLTPWLAHLVRFGYAGAIFALLALALPLVGALRMRRRRAVNRA
jgi:hypothetical protein